MATIKLAIVKEPTEGTRNIIIGKAPFFVGQGDTNLFCGSCDNTLAESIVIGQIRDIILKCPECGEYCEQTPLAPFVVPEGRIIRLMEENFNFSAPVKCSPDVAIVGAMVTA